jgi:hypothetical protein
LNFPGRDDDDFGVVGEKRREREGKANVENINPAKFIFATR